MCTVEFEFDQRRDWIWKHDEEIWILNMIDARFVKDVKIMMWIAIREDDCLIFDFLNDDFDSTREDVTKRRILQMYKKNLSTIMKIKSIFMQNNVSIHIVKIVKNLFKKMNYKMLENWSVYSFDLNSIEHVWFHLKKLVYELHFELLRMKDDNDAKKKNFEECNNACVEEIARKKILFDISFVWKLSRSFESL